MYSTVRNMKSTISVDDLAALSWALLIAKHENEQMQYNCQDKDSLDYAILTEEYGLFVAAERIVQNVWANAKVEDEKWPD